MTNIDRIRENESFLLNRGSTLLRSCAHILLYTTVNQQIQKSMVFKSGGL